MNGQLGSPDSNRLSRVRRPWYRRWWFIVTVCLIGGAAVLFVPSRLIPSSNPTVSRVAALIPGLITLTGLLLAFLSMKESRALQTRMDKVHALISTKYVASFPADMDCLIDLLRSAQREISILVDVAGYGHMSRHGSFKQYEQLLITKKEMEKVDIHIAMYDMDSWDVITPRLFTPAPDEKQRERDPEQYDYVSKLKKREELEAYWSDLDQRLKANDDSPSNKDAIRTHTDFIAQLRKDEIHYRETIPGIEVKLSTLKHLPLLCWMIDGNHAVYSFIFDRSDEGICEKDTKLPSLPMSIESEDPYARYQDTIYEITFTTSDPNLIEVLKNVMWSYAPSLKIDQKTRPLSSRQAIPGVQKEQS